MAKPERENHQSSVDQLTKLDIELLAPTQPGPRLPLVKFAGRPPLLRLILYGFHIEDKDVSAIWANAAGEAKTNH